MRSKWDSSRRGLHWRAALLLGADLSAMFMSWFVAAIAALVAGKAEPGQWFPPASLGGTVFTLLSLLVVLALAASGQYWRRAPFWEETRLVWRQIAAIALINFGLNFFLQVSFTRTLTLMAWLLALLFVPLGRIVARQLLLRIGLWRRRALLLGSGEQAQSARDAIARESHMALEIVRTVSAADFARMSARDDALPCDGISLETRIEDLAREEGCEVILVVVDESTQVHAARIVLALHAASFEVFVVPALFGLPVQGMQAQHFFSNDVLLLRLQHRLLSPLSRWLKRAVDVALSLALLLVFSPLMAFVAWTIWREDGLPVFYTQKRVGRGLRDFEFIKFRTMVKDADARLAAWKDAHPELLARYEASNFKLDDDPRVLGAGGWIRRSSIDELPQLWNVLRGDMSLVGPRPLLRRELDQYLDESLSLYEKVLPGLTGLWQVSGRSSTTFRQRAELDSWYVRNWSLWVDFVILLKTFQAVVLRRGAM